MIRTAHSATSRPPGRRCGPSGAAGRGLRTPKRVCLYLACSFRGFDGPRGGLRNGFLSLTGPVNLKKRISDASLEDSRREKHGPWTAGPAFRCHKGAPGNPVNTRGNALRRFQPRDFLTGSEEPAFLEEPGCGSLRNDTQNPFVGAFPAVCRSFRPSRRAEIPERVCLYLACSFRGFDGPRCGLRNGFLSLTGPVNLKKWIQGAMRGAPGSTS